MKLILDAFGGDNAPSEIVKGAIMAINSLDIEIILVGNKSLIQEELKKNNFENNPKIEIYNATEIINNDDDPTTAVKTKKDSSLVVGATLLKEGKGDAFISAGNTGALVTAASLIVKRIKGVKRAALAPILPSQKGCFMLIDAGATTDFKPEYYLQFGIMGSIYMKKIMGIENPKVGLVNVGTEETKGPELVCEAYSLLKKAPINFIGNVESRYIPQGIADVVVCDGFVGNVILKLYEGLGLLFYNSIKSIFTKNIISKLSALLVKSSLKAFKKQVDYTEHGGAILLGIDGLVIKAHGSSKASSIYYSLLQAKKSIESKMIDDIRNHIKNLGVDSDV